MLPAMGARVLAARCMGFFVLLLLTLAAGRPSFGFVAGFIERPDEFDDAFPQAAGDGLVGAMKRDVDITGAFSEADLDVVHAIRGEFEIEGPQWSRCFLLSDLLGAHRGGAGLDEFWLRRGG